MSAMISKDLLRGLKLEMVSLGAYVPKPAEEPVAEAALEEKDPPVIDAPSSEAPC